MEQQGAKDTGIRFWGLDYVHIFQNLIPNPHNPKPYTSLKVPPMINYDKILIQPNTTINLRDYDTDNTGKLKDKGEGKDLQKDNIKKLKDLQEMLYAFNRYSVLLIFQAMDAAGKDSTIEHVMSGVNPQGCQVFSFKQPSANELEHDFLWRTYKSMPQRGRIGIFNRSYYEEVLVTRVHPEYILGQRIPGSEHPEGC